MRGIAVRDGRLRLLMKLSCRRSRHKRQACQKLNDSKGEVSGERKLEIVLRPFFLSKEAAASERRSIGLSVYRSHDDGSLLLVCCPQEFAVAWRGCQLLHSSNTPERQFLALRGSIVRCARRRFRFHILLYLLSINWPYTCQQRLLKARPSFRVA